MTDGEGEIYEHVQYFPHGEIWADERSNTERLPYLFTGKELDQETGLYDFGARQYDPRVGVWLSPDPALPEYLDGRDGIGGESTGHGGVYVPVHLSAYAYANLRPVVLVDPDGRWAGLP